LQTRSAQLTGVSIADIAADKSSIAKQSSLPENDLPFQTIDYCTIIEEIHAEIVCPTDRDT
jgi:hypothetical protein